METAIWVAIITSTASVIGAIVAAGALLRKRDADAEAAAQAADARFRAEMTKEFGEIKAGLNNVLYRVDQLEEEQRKSNNIKERLARNEESAKSAHLRINRLEGAAAK